MADVSTLPSVELGVLGPLHVRQDGAPVTIPGAKPSSLSRSNCQQSRETLQAVALGASHDRNDDGFQRSFISVTGQLERAVDCSPVMGAVDNALRECGELNYVNAAAVR
jgi:hypothetical protein